MTRMMATIPHRNPRPSTLRRVANDCDAARRWRRDNGLRCCTDVEAAVWWRPGATVADYCEEADSAWCWVMARVGKCVKEGKE